MAPIRKSGDDDGHCLATMLPHCVLDCSAPFLKRGCLHFRLDLDALRTADHVSKRSEIFNLNCTARPQFAEGRKSLHDPFQQCSTKRKSTLFRSLKSLAALRQSLLHRNSLFAMRKRKLSSKHPLPAPKRHPSVGRQQQRPQAQQVESSTGL